MPRQYLSESEQEDYQRQDARLLAMLEELRDAQRAIADPRLMPEASTGVLRQPSWGDTGRSVRDFLMSFIPGAQAMERAATGLPVRPEDKALAGGEALTAIAAPLSKGLMALGAGAGVLKGAGKLAKGALPRIAERMGITSTADEMMEMASKARPRPKSPGPLTYAKNRQAQSLIEDAAASVQEPGLGLDEMQKVFGRTLTGGGSWELSDEIRNALSSLGQRGKEAFWNMMPSRETILDKLPYAGHQLDNPELVQAVMDQVMRPVRSSARSIANAVRPEDLPWKPAPQSRLEIPSYSRQPKDYKQAYSRTGAKDPQQEKMWWKAQERLEDYPNLQFLHGRTGRQAADRPWQRQLWQAYEALAGQPDLANMALAAGGLGLAGAVVDRSGMIPAAERVLQPLMEGNWMPKTYAPKDLYPEGQDPGTAGLGSSLLALLGLR